MDGSNQRPDVCLIEVRRSFFFFFPSSSPYVLYDTVHQK